MITLTAGGNVLASGAREPVALVGIPVLSWDTEFAAIRCVTAVPPRAVGIQVSGDASARIARHNVGIRPCGTEEKDS